MEISSRGLSARQRSILLALLYQMVELRELDLTASVETLDPAAPTLQDVVLRTTAKLLHQLHLRLSDANPLRVLTSAGYRVAADPVVRSYIYLSGCFSDVQVSDLYFTGVSAPQTVQDDDRPIGRLDDEFADAESRQALMAELRAWASRDPEYQARPGNTIEKVAAELRRRESSCIDPVKFCSGVNLEGVTREYGHGRRNQTLDGQAQERLGHGDSARQDDGGGSQPRL